MYGEISKVTSNQKKEGNRNCINITQAGATCPQRRFKPLNRLFQTNDLDLAAYLYAAFFRPMKVEHREGGPAFTFPGEAALSAEAFYAGAAIPAKNLLYAVHRLETIGGVNQNEHVFA